MQQLHSQLHVAHLLHVAPVLSLLSELRELLTEKLRREDERANKGETNSRDGKKHASTATQ